MSERTGQCLCGAVKYRATVGENFNTCYCEMCRRWSSGAFMGASTEAFQVTEGEDVLTVFESSEWAVRGFCSKCGSNIYYHAVAHGGPSVAMGTLDDTAGLVVSKQFFIDEKPEGFSLAESTATLTRAEIMKMFGAQ